MLVTRDNYAERLAYFGQRHDPLVVDVETTGLSPYRGDYIIGIALAAGGESAYFPFRHAVGDNLPEDDMTPILKLVSQAPRVVGHNVKFDLQMLALEGMELPDWIEDTMVLMHMLDENQPTLALKELAVTYLGEEEDQEEIELMERLHAMGYRGKGAKAKMYKLPPSDVAAYAAKDASLTEQLWHFAHPQLDDWMIKHIYEEQSAYLRLLTKMEMRGFKVNRQRVLDYKREAELSMDPVKEEIKQMSGGLVTNPNSPPQVCRWLNINSARAKVLELLANNEGVAKVLEYKAWMKMATSYYDKYLKSMSLPDMEEVEPDVIHTSFWVTGSILRLSCSDPPLQAVPRYRLPIYKVKDVYEPRPGYWLVEADYSQAEMRIACNYTNDKGMRQVLESGGDLHGAAARELGIPRDVAKRINFGVVYGLGPPGLAGQLGIPEHKSKEYLDIWHSGHPNFRMLYRIMDNYASDYGMIRLWTGRVRRYRDFVGGVHAPWQRLETRKAMSNLIQGSVAELMRRTMLGLEELEQWGIHQIIQVHDSVLFEVSMGGDFDEKMGLIKGVMENTAFDSPAMKVDMKYSANHWGDMQPWEGPAYWPHGMEPEATWRNPITEFIQQVR